MRKHDEGYALSFVLLVILILTLVATSALSLPLRNLKNQQNSIQRMQDRYAAEGRIQVALAHLNKGLELSVSSGDAELSLDDSSVKEAIVKAVSEKLELLPDEEAGISVAGEEEENTDSDGDTTASDPFEMKNYSFVLASEYGTARVVCELELSGTVKTEERDEKPICTAEFTEVHITSYDISKIDSVSKPFEITVAEEGAE